MFITKEEFENKDQVQSNNAYSADIFKDKTDRTLMYGYDMDRNTVHIYLHEGIMCAIKYTYDGKILSEERGEFDEIYHVLPSKRAYPESTDKEFFEILKYRNEEVVYTTFDQKRADMLKGLSYHGKIYEDLKK